MTTVGTTIQSPSNVTYLPNVTSLPIELTCDVTAVAPTWRVNSTNHLFSDIMNGMVPGLDISGINILIITPVNNTKYVCRNGTDDGDPYYISIAGKYVHVHVCKLLSVHALFMMYVKCACIIYDVC